MPAGRAPVSLRPLTPEDKEDVQSLWTRRFGGRPSTQENWIHAALDPDHSATGTVAEPQTDDPIAGFGLVEVGSPEYTKEYLGLDTLGLHPPLDSRNGIFHMYCVRGDWEGHGIGSRLYGRHLDLLRERDVPRAFGISWHRPHTIDSRVLFEKWGFTSFASVEEYYARTGGRANCPDCNGACGCTASLYIRPINTSE